MPSERARPGAWQVARRLAQPHVAVMMALGFASGLPFMLVGNTLGFWLRESGVPLAAIGFLSWVGIAYSMKFLWAPIIDGVNAPLAARLGRRRGWMLLGQAAVIVGLIGLAVLGPGPSLLGFGGLALLAAFGSATQDIAVDAWRIESAVDAEDLALLTAAAQLGYRAAILITDALILILAAGIGWPLSYGVMAVLMAVGVGAVLCAREPARAAAAAARAPIFTARGLSDAIAGPFVSFFRAHGRWALVMLAAVSLYRMPDFVMGPMANPFYVDLGLDKALVGEIRGSVGLIATIAGIAAGGLCALRFGFVATLIIGAVVGPASNLAFSVLAFTGPQLGAFAAAMAVDNFSLGFAGIALVSYMSSLTSAGYTATQYALLTSFYALLGKVLKGFSGVTVDALARSMPLLDAYAWFFAGTAAIGLPALILCVILTRKAPARPPTGEAASGAD